MKTIISTVLTIFCTLTLIAQKIEENKVDEFKGISIIRTDWEDLIKKGSNWVQNRTKAIYRFSKLNGNVMLDIKLVLSGGEVFAIGKDFELIFLFEDGSTSTYNAIEDVVASRGGGTTGFAGSALWGAEMSYLGEFSELLKKEPKKVRVYTDEGYVEDEIKEKDSKKLQKSLELILQTEPKSDD